MSEQTRSDFWKCEYDAGDGYTYSQICGEINPAGHPCECGHFSSTADSPVTNRELLAAWLLAPDDRRREIEIASRPKEAGIYCRYRLGVRETIETWIVNVETDAEAQEIRDSEGRGLWEKYSKETTVVNLRKEPYDVYIGRAGKGQDGYFGNPFVLRDGESRGSMIEQYREYFNHRIATDAEFKQRIEALRGKRLGCFCKPAPCHGDVIVEYLNSKGEM